MKVVVLVVLFCLLPSLASAQCSTHSRHIAKPWTWLNSNMCDADYQAWKQERIASGEWQKPFWKDKTFWLGTGVIGGSVAADMGTTSWMRGQGGIEENTLLYGRYPSNTRITEVGIGAFATYFALHIVEYKLSHNDPSEAWRTFGQWGVPAAVVGVHGSAAVHNLRNF